MTTFPNGHAPDDALTPIPGGGRLLAPVAVVWRQICADVQAAHGWTPEPTGPHDSYRPYRTQLSTFTARYTRTARPGRPTKVWDGVTYWLLPGNATAAVPGRSNHGWACAVDVTDLGGFTSDHYEQFAAVAARYGWTNTEGRRIDEPWHWVDVRTASQVAGGSFDIGVAPIALEEDDMTPDQEAKLDQAVADAAEARRMLGVLMGWQPAQGPEGTALLDLRTSPAEARRMLGVLLGWQPPQGPEGAALERLFDGQPPVVQVDEAELAKLVAAAIPAALAPTVAVELAKLNGG